MPNNRLLASANLIIRQEQPGDHQGIAEVTAKAFADVEHSDQSEPAIVARLRAAGALTVSLVAIEQAIIIGHVAFSPVTIDGAECGWLALGPVSVRPDRQGQGIGGALIRRGLEQLRSRGAAGCVLVGDPVYYRRFGFEQDGRLQCDAAPPEYFMWIALSREQTPTGGVDFHSAFSG